MLAGAIAVGLGAPVVEADDMLGEATGVAAGVGLDVATAVDVRSSLAK